MVSSEVKPVTAAKGNTGANRTASKQTLVGEEENDLSIPGTKKKI